MLYALGSNGSGQLGLRHQDDVSTPSCHICLAEVASHSPAQIAAGGKHSLILYQSGLLSSTDLTSSESSTSSNTNVLGRNIRLCSATWEVSLLCSHDSCVTAFGRGEKGELGLGDGIVHVAPPGLPVDVPLLKESGVSIVDMASGVQHSVVVLSTGDVVGWGNGRKGQLGEPAGIVWKPRKIENIPFKAKRAVCGREFTYILGDSSEGRHLILGSDRWLVKTGAPEVIREWKDVGASWGSILVLLESGDIISWGRNDHGQLSPPALPKVDKIAVGSEHVLAVTKSNIVCAWGWGEHGNCGPVTDSAGDVKKGYWNVITLPGSEIPLVRGIGAGCATSWIWT